MFRIQKILWDASYYIHVQTQKLMKYLQLNNSKTIENQAFKNVVWVTKQLKTSDNKRLSRGKVM